MKMDDTDRDCMKDVAEVSEVKELLCLFFKFTSGSILYSLYAYVVEPRNYRENPNTSPPPPPSSPPLTILEMLRGKDFPIGMACAKLDSRIYFVGGQCKIKEDFYASRKVYYLDVDKVRNRFRGLRWNTTSKGLVGSDELLQCPNMHGGKSNPIVIVANKKLYVITGFINGDPNNKTLAPPPHFNDTDWTSLFIDDYEWRRYSFEVYDPVTNEWTVIPLRTSSSSPADSILPFYCHGHAVVHDKIFFSYYGGTSSIFDLQTQTWKFFYTKDIKNTPSQTYDDALALAFVPKPLFGRGLTLNGTLYAFAMADGEGCSAFYAYHIPASLEDTLVKSSSIELTGSYLFETSSLSALQAGFFHLGEEKFCSIYCEDDVYFVVFELKKSYKGGIKWSKIQSERTKITGTGADSGSILDFFTLYM